MPLINAMVTLFSLSEGAKIFARAVEMILTIAASVFLVIYGWSQFDNVPPIRFISSDAEVTTAPDGRSFWVKRETCLDRDVPASLLPSLSGVDNERLIPLMVKPMSALMGCREYSILVLLPAEVPPGDYIYHLKFRFHMNPFKTLSVDAKPVRVRVLQ